jgi:hypothetical protein
LNKWVKIVETALYGTGQGPFYDPKVFNLGVGDLTRNQIFAIVRTNIGKTLLAQAKEPPRLRHAEFRARAAQLVEDVLNGATSAYPEGNREAAKVEFLVNGFTKPSVAIKNFLLQRPEFEAYRKDAFIADLGL